MNNPKLNFQQYFVQEKGKGQFEPEHKQVYETLLASGISVQPFTLKRLERRQISFTKNDFVFGDHDVIRRVLKMMELPMPPQNDYPQSLKAHFHRSIWQSDLNAVLDALDHPMASPVFVKPAGQAKRFTGFVASSPVSDLYRFNGASKHSRVFCSEPVEWKSEFRAYVCRDELLGVFHYAGDREAPVDLSVISASILLLKNANENTAGYSLDFGLLSTGETALIEMNDGFALGNYGLPAQDYTKLVLARWAEMVKAPV